MLSTRPSTQVSEIKARPVQEKKAGWSVKDWCSQVSISPAYFYELKKKGLITTAKIFGKSIVLDDPAEWLAQFIERAA
jgi:hypothetical protein